MIDTITRQTIPRPRPPGVEIRCCQCCHILAQNIYANGFAYF